MNETICAAIHTRRQLAFDYGGRPRVVVPYCHGQTQSGEVLRAIQVDGESSSGGFGFGKLWKVAEMRNVRITGEPFSPDDPNYNPDDSAMTSVHCRV